MSRLSTSEIKALIERALRPDACHFEDHHDGWMGFTVVSEKDPSFFITIPVRLDTLHSSRAIAELVGEARFLLSNTMTAKAANVSG